MSADMYSLRTRLFGTEDLSEPQRLTTNVSLATQLAEAELAKPAVAYVELMLGETVVASFSKSINPDD